MNFLYLVSALLGLSMGIAAIAVVRDHIRTKCYRCAWIAGIFGVLLLFFLLFPQPARADRERTELECKQASGMMANVGVSRDRGVHPATIFEAFGHDIEAAKQFPPKARWFVEEEADAMLLYRWLQRVFEKAEPVEEIRFKFFIDCMGGRVSES